jgi:diaminopropionate ammonia-lyase
MNSVLKIQSPGFHPDPSLPKDLFKANFDYQETPVLEVDLTGTPTCRLLIKDERSRLGLASFKALGGIYAVARLIAKHWLSQTGQNLSAADYQQPAVRELAASITFVCASAGNHGLAVARGAAHFGTRTRVHLAATVPEAFAERLRAEGAQVLRSGADYEASVALALQDAEQSGAILLADGSWPGYFEAPALVMEGYTLMAEELRGYFLLDDSWPSQVYLQAGVGGLAAAMACMIRERWVVQPEIIIVEPGAAPCLRDSVAAGQMVRVKGPVSNMGRLDCKEPSLLALHVLSDTADRFITVCDEQADAAQQELALLGVDTTPSGAAGFAGLRSDCGRRDASGQILIIATEAVI